MKGGAWLVLAVSALMGLPMVKATTFPPVRSSSPSMPSAS